MRLHTRVRSGRRRTTPALSGVAGTAVLAVVVASGVTAPAVSAAPPGDREPSECPAVAAGVADGERLTGRTVVDGSTPEEFTAEVVGVLDNGVAPDVDLVVVRVSSPEVTRVGGIWQGMSGSPVYNGSGELVGAVAYGFSYGGSPVAGVTPAAQMYDLFTTPATTATSAPRLAETVPVPAAIQREIVAQGAATVAEAASDMAQLPLPVAVSGPVSGRRIEATLDRMGLTASKVYRAGGVSATAEAYPIVSGGNLAASVSYGDYSYAAVGTATAVCGTEVVAFGHPFMFTGASALSMHGADTLYVQEDPLWVPYKVANPGAPSGTIVQDRLAGLLGVVGEAPDAAEITSTVSLGGATRTGSTAITVPGYVPDIAAWHTFVNHEKVFDAHAPGAQTMTWTVAGLREDGSLFGYTKSDRFADPGDIIWSAADQVFMELYRLQNNGSEQVQVKDVTTTSAMSERYAKFTIRRVMVRAGSAWRPLPNHMVVRPGQLKRFRVTLASAQLPDRYARLRVTIPRNAAGFSYISILGGSEYGGYEDFWYEPMAGSTLDKVLASITGEPRNDHVVAGLRFRRVTGGWVERSVRRQVGAIVTGARGVMVEVVR